MPIYEYECESCGVFTDFRKMSESQEPSICPDCGELAERIMSAPSLAILDMAKRSAHEKNEKSANAPAIRRKSSCGCSGAHTCNSSHAAGEKKSEKKAVGKKGAGQDTGFRMQTKKSARPWMLGH